MQQHPSDPRRLLGWLSDAAPTLYLVAGGLLLLVFSLLTPPFFNADEIAHAERGLQVSHGEWIAYRGQPGDLVNVWLDKFPPADAPLAVRPLAQHEDAYGTTLDRDFLLAATRGTYIQNEFLQTNRNWTERPDGKMPLASLAALQAIHWARSSVFVPFPNTAVYPPPLYFFAAAAWRVGEMRNASVVSTLLVARLLNACVALVLGWLALRIASGSGLLFLAFLLLPAVLTIESSCAQDALIVPMAVLCVSLLVRALAQQRLFCTGELTALALCLALCAAGRPPYLALSVVLFLPSLERRALRLRALLGPLTAAAAVLFAFGTWRFLIRGATLSHSAIADPSAQLAFMKAHSLATSAALVRGTIAGIPEQVFRGVEIIELKGVATMALLYGPHILAFVGIVLLTRQVVLQRPVSRLLLAAALLAIVGGIAVVEYIIWTAPGAPRVIGAQARYYLPMLPFACLLAFRHRSVESVSSRFTTAAPRLLLACLAVYFAGVLYTPFLLAHRYYAVNLFSALAHVLR